MTDRELVDAAVASFKQTQVSGIEYQRRLALGVYPDPLATKWGKGFDLLSRVGQIIVTPPPGTSAPWPGWSHEVSGRQVATPDRHFAYSGDALRLLCYGDTPVMGPGTPFPRHLVSSYLQNGQALAGEGVTVDYATTISFPVDFDSTTGEQNWLLEWHTANGQLSCGIGLRSDFPVSFTSPGRNPTWYFRPIGPSGQRPKIGPALILGRTYQVRVRVKWSSTSAGRFQVWLDGILVCDDAGSNMWAGDLLGFGLYHYRLAVPFTSSVLFTRPTMARV